MSRAVKSIKIVTTNAEPGELAALVDKPAKSKSSILKWVLIAAGILGILALLFFLVILPKMNACGPKNLTGKCSADKVCAAGSCVAKVCGTDNLTGACAVDGETCVAGKCVSTSPLPPGPNVDCSATKPCEDPNYTCVKNKCSRKVECSADVACADKTKQCKSGICVVATQDPGQPCTEANPLGTCTDNKICDAGRCRDPAVYNVGPFLKGGTSLYQNAYLKSLNKKYYLRQNIDTRLCLYQADDTGNLKEVQCWGTAKTGNPAANSWTTLMGENEMVRGFSTGRNMGDLCIQYAEVFNGPATNVTPCIWKNNTSNKTGPFFLNVSDDGKVCVFVGKSGEDGKAVGDALGCLA